MTAAPSHASRRRQSRRGSEHSDHSNSLISHFSTSSSARARKRPCSRSTLPSSCLCARTARYGSRTECVRYGRSCRDACGAACISMRMEKKIAICVEANRSFSTRRGEASFCGKVKSRRTDRMTSSSGWISCSPTGWMATSLVAQR